MHAAQAKVEAVVAVSLSFVMLSLVWVGCRSTPSQFESRPCFQVSTRERRDFVERTSGLHPGLSSAEIVRLLGKPRKSAVYTARKAGQRDDVLEYTYALRECDSHLVTWGPKDELIVLDFQMDKLVSVISNVLEVPVFPCDLTRDSNELHAFVARAQELRPGLSPADVEKLLGEPTARAMPPQQGGVNSVLRYTYAIRQCNHRQVDMTTDKIVTAEFTSDRLDSIESNVTGVRSMPR
jgi:hypothetical protein